MYIEKRIEAREEFLATHIDGDRMMQEEMVKKIMESTRGM